MGYWRKVREGSHRKKKILLRAYKEDRPTREPSQGASYSQCFKKTAYASLRYAERLAQDIQDTRGQKIRVYTCPGCGMYHLAKDNHNV